MKLIEFDSRDIHSGSTDHPMISVGYNSGYFTLNREAVRITGVQAGAKVTIIQDEDSPKDWYLRIAYNNFGFKLRETKGGTMVFAARSVAHRLIKACFSANSTHRMMLSPEKEGDMWPIITKSGKQVRISKEVKA